MPSKNFTIRHTRIKLKTDIIDAKLDKFNPLAYTMSFLHDRVSGYYLKKSLIPYAVHKDRELYDEFYGTEFKILNESQDTVHIIESYALPHFGFPIDRGAIQPGNKIRIRFRSKNPEGYDVNKFYLYYDNKTGTYEDDPIGVIDAKTGSGGGRLLKSARIVS